MPLRSDPGNYSFFLDFEGAQHEPAVADVLEKLEGLTIGLKLLGSYPSDCQSALSGDR
jgi:prephenate dehydratase